MLAGRFAFTKSRFWKRQSDFHIRYHIRNLNPYQDRIHPMHAGHELLQSRNLPLKNLQRSTRETAEAAKNNTYHILVVSDSSNHVNELLHILTRDYFQLTIINRGKEAYSLLHEWYTYDVVIIDASMQPESAKWLCQQIRQSHQLHELPILLITSELNTKSEGWYLYTGANDTAKLPLHRNEVLMRVLTLCKFKQSMYALNLAEMKVRRSIIKPHFLFNVMNTLISLCYDSPHKAGLLLKDFSTYLRNSVDFQDSGEWTTIEREIQSVEVYWAIVEARFGSHMQLNCEIDPSAMNCKIPLFTVQPLVENAIIHGLNHIEQSGVVDVQIRLIRDQLHIHIQDNGRGISQEIINQVMNGNQLPNSLALSNIHARLRSLTGHGLHIESEIGYGTKVSLSIPQKR